MRRTVHSSSVVTCLAAACLAAPALAEEKAADYPNRPIRVVIGIAPGGGLDTTTRIAAQKLTERFGQTAVVDNRPGGGTVLAMDLVAQATPDGYTLLCASETLILNGVFKRAKYDVRKAFVPMVQLTAQPYLLAVNPSLPVKTVKDLVALAKSKPGALGFGTPGVGTTLHIGWERMIAMTGMELLHVPYKGGALAILDVISGQIQMLMTTTPTVKPHVKSGKVRLVAATGLKRNHVFPDLPTVSESGLEGYELTNSYAFFAPAGTPPAVVAKVNAALSQSLNAPDMLKILAAEGAEVAAPATPDQFRAKFEALYASMENTTRIANILLK